MDREMAMSGGRRRRAAVLTSSLLAAALLVGCTVNDSPESDRDIQAVPVVGDGPSADATAWDPAPPIEAVEGPPLALVRSADRPSNARPASLVRGTVSADGACLSLRSETGDVSPLLLPPGSVVAEGGVELPDGAVIVGGEEFKADGFWMPVSELAVPLPECAEADLVAFVFSPEDS